MGGGVAYWVEEDRRGEGALWSRFPKDPPHPKLPQSLMHSVFFYRVLTTGPDLHQVLGGREPPVKPNQWLQEVSIPGSKANRF